MLIFMIHYYQCRQRLATAATFLLSCEAQALSHGDGPRHYSYMPLRNAPIVMKI